ncbi:hypothetical protein ES332_D05G270900v1 [Gossypium tomentosum]|uniref:Pectinesterase inhibitor domain-containing protein n=4 Tax=Gossypium TaxID=3633 RepID=A0A5D2L009_GOSTO|nr:hypothetical protein ES332_D05G270900v1 [Gossypium tomentosum]
MASQSHFINVIFTILFLSVNFFSPSRGSASKALIAKVCGDDAILDHDFCLKALSNAQANAAKSVNQLVDVAMKEAVAKAHTTLKVIVEMMKKPSSPATLEALKTCQNVYKNSIRSFGMISDELSEDAMSANYDVSLIGPDAETCIKALAAASVNAPEIANGNHDLQYFSSLGHGMTAKMN